MRTVIAYLLELLDAPGRRRLRTMLALQAAQGVLQGVGFLCLVPLLAALADEPAGAGRLWFWVAAIGLTVGVHHGLLARSTALGYRVGADVLTSLHARIGDRLTTLPLGWFGVDRAGPVGRLIGKSVVDVADFPSHLLRHVVVGVCAPVTLILGSYLADWRIGIALTAAAMLCAAAVGMFMLIVHRNDARYERDIGATASRIVEYARLQPTLRAYGVRDPRALPTLEGSLTRQQRSQYRLTVRGARGLIGCFATMQLVVTAVIVFAVVLTLRGELAVTTMIGLLIITVRMVDPLSALADLAGHIQVTADAIRRVRRLLGLSSLPEPDRAAPTPAGTDIELRGVRFGYHDGVDVIRGVDAVIPAGGLTAIVGPSGSGKTTLLRLIARFFDVDDGAILLGGHDLRDLGTAAVTGLIAQVFEDTYLFDDTIAANVAMADPAATAVSLDSVAAISRLAEVIDRLPDGWATRVGEAGEALSGGERQRVAIARALLKDAPVLLLDEATAALDAVNAAAVTNAVGELAGDRTVVVVAHQLSTVIAADQILVLDDGRICERGTHEQLVTAGGTYTRFWEARLRARGWQLVRNR